MAMNLYEGVRPSQGKCLACGMEGISWRKDFNFESGPSSSSILQEAEQIINGPRQEAYGDVKDSFSRVALFWSEIIGTRVTYEQVAMCMIALKLCRERNKHSRDNLVDICGYAALLDKLIDQKSDSPQDSPPTGV